jgi:hypothetical protein
MRKEALDNFRWAPRGTRQRASPVLPGRATSLRKWMNFYIKLLVCFAIQTGLNVALQVIVELFGRVSQQQLDEMRAALTLRRLVSLIINRFSDGR